MKLNQKILSEDLFLVISIINYQIYIERGKGCYLEIVVCMYIRILVNNLKLYFCYVNYIFINIVVNIIQKIKMKYIFIVYIGNV